eukprot:Em0007g1345a
MPTFTPLTSGENQLQVQSQSLMPMPSNQAPPSFDPITGLPARFVKRILEFEFVEMADMLPDSWQEQSQTGTDTHPLTCRLVRRASITDITLWQEGFTCQEFRRHCVGGLRPPVSQEALAQKDLNWSEVKSWLYSEAFTGCTKIILRCRYCLSEMHNVRACPSNPDTGILDLFYRTSGPLTHLAKDICRNYNDGRCHYDRCKYQHICH